MLVLVFLVVPFVELFVLIKVGGQIGVGPTILVVLAVSVVGAWLVKREGRKAWSRIGMQLRQGSLPADDVIDGALIMLSGALMITPGFVTDLVALALLVPPIRAVARAQLKRRYGQRLTISTMPTGFPSGPRAGGGRTNNGEFIDVESDAGEP